MEHDVKQKYYIDFYGNVYYTAQSFHFSLCHILDGNLQYVEGKTQKTWVVLVLIMCLDGIYSWTTKENLAVIGDGSQQQNPLTLKYYLKFLTNFIICTALWFSLK